MPKTLIAPELYAATFPLECSTCQKKSGMPYKASTIPGGTKVEIRCTDCAREWTFELRLEEPPVLLEKPDRRDSE